MSDWRVLTRRWYVILVGLLATAGLAFAAASVVPVQHQVMANVLMLPPRTVNTEGKVTNPYLDLGGLEGIADVVCKTLSEESVTKSLTAISDSAQYTVIRDPSSAAPVILITVIADTAKDALAIQQALLDRIPQTLAAIQRSSSVRSDSRISSSVLTHDTTSTVIQKSRIRALVVVVVGGLGFTLLSAALIDGVLRSRRSERPGQRRGARGAVPGLLDEAPPVAGGLYADYDEAAARPRSGAYADYNDETVIRPATLARPQYPEPSLANGHAVGYPEHPQHADNGAARPQPVGYPTHPEDPRGRPAAAAPHRRGPEAPAWLAPTEHAGAGTARPRLAALYENSDPGPGDDDEQAGAPAPADPTMTQPRGVDYGALTLRKFPKPQEVRDSAP